MTLSRLATSSGADIDSWVGDFGLVRLAGSPALGAVTLASFAPQSQSAVVTVGTTVKSSDGLSTFIVTEDPTNSVWSAAANAYIRPAGTPSITVPIEATVVGSSGNVQAGTINLLGQAIAGIDTVNNALPLHSGLNAETDDSLRSRFIGYINSRARATIVAVQTAVLAVQQGLTTTVIENTDAAGNPRVGSFTVVVDDGSGSPPPALLSSVYAAVDLVRPVGSIFAVIGPKVILANVSLSLTIMSGADPASVSQNVLFALTGFIDGLPVGASLPYSKLANIAYQADSNVLNVLGLTLNGGTADVGGGVSQVVKASSITVS